MGNQLVWQDRFNIGVEFIDREHKKLFSIMNKLFSSDANDENSQWVFQEGIKYFKRHAMKHFAEEEVYMASIGYIGFETHRRLHDNFRLKTLPALEKELERTNYSQEAVDHFMGVCAGWLIGHTLTEDRAITGKVTSNWIGLLPEEEQAAMREVIKQLLNDLFGLKAKVISSNYGGEKFGKGIYYRLAYVTQEGDTWETILVFEEKLLLNTMGQIIGTVAEEVDTMVMNATRYTAQQFLNRISEHFPSAAMYELREENLLTYEQFNATFAREHVQCSLLFDTGEGYFAYCIIAPHLLQNGLGTSITAENAMAEIKEYLKKNEEVKKKKILLVDDSDVVRHAIKGLLEEDYQVSMANSGLSAFRGITLDRPDLVLLDYEMPVCDGRQVLEMIRSEKEMADIPVIFLTGRVDRQSVEKVKALKPDGYLVKSLNPAEIKKNIDVFFERQNVQA
ncbi:MAG: response regulator [Lachnospiraceae bacterium]|nr:response regulator [Lachnospiraceae bacterium]